MVRPTARDRLKPLFAVLAVAAGILLIPGCGSSDPPTIADLVPHPEIAWEDKGPAILDGCRSGTTYTDAWTCVYGFPASKKTVILWGDSHAMQFTPPLIELARQRGWRLVTMFRGDCLTADVQFTEPCDAWRANALRRIREEKPQLIITSTDTGSGYALWQDGERLDRRASEPLLHAGYAKTLRQLERATGDRPGGVVVLRDLPRATFRPPDCLLENPEDFAACDFRGTRKNPPGFDFTAANQVKGVKLVDISESVCPGGTCNAARDGMVIYRDATHISATYAATLADLLGEEIGDF